MDFFAQFNAAQQQAVTAPLQPILVLAGPGTGKTRTLVGRILYLIQYQRMAPHKILAVTFTNKAKEEMKHRLRHELGDAASDLKIGTFHRFCLTVLREHFAKAGLPKQFAIADEPTQLLTLARASRIQDERSLNMVLNAISSYRLNRANLNPNFQELAAKWISPYHQELRKNNLIDFDQILLLTQALFDQSPELVETYRQTFDAILVDEFQDTDPIQYALMKALAWRHRNIFVVADDDQSIFAWRGAQIENIDRYVREFACQQPQIILLNENYRSAQCIIDAATQLINCGPRFRQKQINAVIQDSEIFPPEILFLPFPDDETETRFIVEQIQALTQIGSAGVPPAIPSGEGTAGDADKLTALPGKPHLLRYAEIAILYPTHAIGDRLEAQLLAMHIPCQLVKRQGVFDQADVRKIVLLLKILQNPEDDVALEQFFELELHDKLVFQQIQALKTRGVSFKQTLRQLLTRRAEIAGIAKDALRRTITATFGIISNMLSYLAQNPEVTLAELINMLCNLTAPVQTATIHSVVQQLCDPLELPGIPAAVEQIELTAARGGVLYVCGRDAILNTICGALFARLESPLAVASISSSEGKLATTLAAAPNSDADSFLCLDEASGAALRTAYPQIAAAQIISSTAPFATVVTVFKLIQALTAAKLPPAFRKYTVLDLETTSGDIQTTGIVEIGAVKVRDGQIIAQFSALVNPEKPITQGAYNVHHISDADVQAAKTFAQLLPEFLEFMGDDLLVAHNGFDFDFPILLRLYKEVTDQILPNRRFDTLPLARRLFPGQGASVDALLQRFNIPAAGERHRALDDTIFLAQIFERLQAVEQSLNRRSEHEELLELVAFGIYWEALPTSLPAPSPKERGNHPLLLRRGAGGEVRGEEAILFQLGAQKLLSRFSELPEPLRDLYQQRQSDLEALFEQLAAADSISPGERGGDAKEKEPSRRTLVFSGRDAAIVRLKDLAMAFPADNIRNAIQSFLDHATLYNSQDDIRDVNAVNLLTIHSAKGLEFPVVFVSGVEKGNLPSFYSVREEGELGRKKLEEQRRLFYVAMTRAKQKLMITYVNKRGDYEKKRSQFLVELGAETGETAAENEK